MFTFLLIVQTLVSAALVTVILMQRSEGGGLVGGSGSGLMSARGAADFLTRATAVLGTLFVLLSIVLAGLAAVERAPSDIDPSLARRGAPTAPAGTPAAPALPGQVPLATGDPLAGAAEQAGNLQAPAQPVPANQSGVPLAQ